MGSMSRSKMADEDEWLEQEEKHADVSGKGEKESGIGLR